MVGGLMAILWCEMLLITVCAVKTDAEAIVMALGGNLD